MSEIAEPQRAPIPERVRPTPSAFRKEFERPHRPVLVRGLLDDWPALQSWSVDGLAEQHGNAVVSVAMRDREDSAFFSHQSMKLSAYVALLRDPEKRRLYYLSDAPFEKQVPDLAHDVRKPTLAPPHPRTALWISTTGKRSYTHFDVDHSLLSQVVGKKRIYLMSPRHQSELYVSPLRDKSWPQSPVNLAAVDLKRFPRMARAEILECVIGPGDVLFIPSLWWHQVESLEDSISVSFHWEGLRGRLVRFGLSLLGRPYAS